MQAPPFLKKMGDSFKSKGGPGKVLFDAVSKGATKDGVIAALEDCETPEDLAYTSSEGCAPPPIAQLCAHLPRRSLHHRRRYTVLMQLHANHDWPKRSAAILERGVEVNAAAADGTTALHLAAAAGFRESCRVLLQHGADRGQKNAAGATAIDAAKGGGHDQLAAFIDGWTPAALGENTRATDPEL